MQRRSFIKKSSVVLGSIALMPSSFAIPQFFKDSIRVGVIGTGQRGTGLIRLMQGIQGLEVTAICDVLPFRLENALKYSEKSNIYKDYRKLLDDTNVDAVIIATPYNMHGQMAIDAIDAGKHIFCEKTMVKGFQETQKVVNKVKNSSIIFQTGHQYRSSPLFQKVAQIVKSGYIGDITAVECQWNRNGNWRREVPNPKWERLINWRMYREYSGGLVAELMSHQMDFVHWITSQKPKKFTGFGGIDHWKDGRETFDNIHLLVEYDNGIDASYTCTTTNAFEGFQIKVLGDKATIRLKGEHAEIFMENFDKQKGMVDGVSGATMQAWQEGKGAPIEADALNPTRKALVDFRDAVINNTKPVSDVETGALVSKSVDIALETVHHGQIKYWKDYPKLSFEKH